MAFEELEGWKEFYLIVGAAGAALTGLLFVVVALGSERSREGSAEVTQAGIRAFGSANVLHFTMTLVFSGIATIPYEHGTLFVVLVAAAGLVGLGFVADAARHMRRQTAYEPVFEDLLFHLALPILAYAGVVAAAVLVYRGSAPEGLLALAIANLGLLIVGIHNAWDAAVWIATQRPATTS